MTQKLNGKFPLKKIARKIFYETYKKNNITDNYTAQI